ncbi:MAG: hypothetical protein KJN87_04720, partial [Desulfofustis sp.]|nr:hypothetical protein [Desulfofustis sp.]
FCVITLDSFQSVGLTLLSGSKGQRRLLVDRRHSSRVVSVPTHLSGQLVLDSEVFFAQLAVQRTQVGFPIGEFGGAWYRDNMIPLGQRPGQ